MSKKLDDLINQINCFNLNSDYRAYKKLNNKIWSIHKLGPEVNKAIPNLIDFLKKVDKYKPIFYDYKRNDEILSLKITLVIALSRMDSEVIDIVVNEIENTPTFREMYNILGNMVKSHMFGIRTNEEAINAIKNLTKNKNPVIRRGVISCFSSTKLNDDIITIFLNMLNDQEFNIRLAVVFLLVYNKTAEKEVYDFLVNIYENDDVKKHYAALPLLKWNPFIDANIVKMAAKSINSNDKQTASRAIDIFCHLGKDEKYRDLILPIVCNRLLVERDDFLRNDILRNISNLGHKVTPYLINLIYLNEDPRVRYEIYQSLKSIGPDALPYLWNEYIDKKLEINKIALQRYLSFATHFEFRKKEYIPLFIDVFHIIFELNLLDDFYRYMRWFHYYSIRDTKNRLEQLLIMLDDKREWVKAGAVRMLGNFTTNKDIIIKRLRRSVHPLKNIRLKFEFAFALTKLENDKSITGKTVLTNMKESNVLSDKQNKKIAKYI